MGLSRLGTNSWSNPKLGNIVANLNAKLDFPSLGLAHYSIYLNAAMTDTTPKYVSAQVQLMPLCFEIQNGFSFMGLYFNRFVLDLYGYTRYNFKNSNLDYKATAVAYMTVSEAIGMLAKNNVSLGARADYDIKTGEFKVTFYNSLQLDLSSLIPDESSVKIMEF